MLDPYEVIAINRSTRCSLLRNGQLVKWEHMLDADCEVVDNIDEAVFAVHDLPDGSWVTLELSFWKTATIH